MVGKNDPLIAMSPLPLRRGGSVRCGVGTVPPGRSRCRTYPHSASAPLHSFFVPRNNTEKQHCGLDHHDAQATCHRHAWCRRFCSEYPSRIPPLVPHLRISDTWTSRIAQSSSTVTHPRLLFTLFDHYSLQIETFVWCVDVRAWGFLASFNRSPFTRPAG